MDYSSKDLARFWSKVERTESCWNWTGTKNNFGYGMISIGGRAGGYRLAHRVSWEVANGAIPNGKHLDHKCHNKGCINPAHLRPVTNKQNLENLSGPYNNTTSGIRGVSWDSRRSLWRANVVHNYKQIAIGRFPSREAAEAAVVAKRNELFTHNDQDRVA